MVLLAGLVPSVLALFGIVKVYESRAVSLRTAEIQNQCTILTNQISASHYFEDTSQEVVNDSLNQLTNIYNGRVMVIDDQLRVVKDTYSLDEGKLDVSESVVRCMKGTSTNNYDKKNHYIEVTAPIAIPGENQIRGVMLASVSTDSIEDSLDVLDTQGRWFLINCFADTFRFCKCIHMQNIVAIPCTYILDRSCNLMQRT